jgi:ATPase subunit of ABC transporter with duplicated ATPase domains
VFKGRYTDWLTAQEQALESLQHQRQQLKKAQKQAHQRRMQEQERAAHARQRGEKAIQERRWATIRSATKLGRGNTTSDQLCADIRTEQTRQPDFSPTSARVLCRNPHFTCFQARNTAILPFCN